ncbi:MAG: ABC transporter ATP-binding protein [Planctomycetota bacterium]
MITEPKTRAILYAEHLHKTFGQGDIAVPVLQDVSLEVPEGRFVAIMGPSGSGKSTLLHVLSGLDRPDRGTVHIDGQDVYAMKDKARTLLRRDRIGFVFQFFNLVPNLTVSENILLPAMIRGHDPSDRPPILAEILERFRLTQQAERYPHQVSGGEMQRVSIARALLSEPRIIMADEPTGNISSKAGQEVMELLRACRNERQQTILLVTHNPRDAAYADRVHFLKDGQIAEQATLEDDQVDEARILDCLKELDI